MLKCRLVSNFAGRIKQVSISNSPQSARWATSVSLDFDDADLATSKPFEEIPTHAALPLVGTGWVHLPLIGYYDAKRFTEALVEKRKVLGDIFREKIGKMSFVWSFNPDDLQIMFKHEGPYPARFDMESIKVYRESRKQWYTTLGLPLLNGKEWQDLRKKTQKHLMKPKAIQDFLVPMQGVARDFVKKVLLTRDSNKEVPNFLGELNKWGLESVALVALDTRLGCLDLNLHPDSDAMKMIRSLQTAFEVVFHLEGFSGHPKWWKLFPTPTWKKFVEESDVFTGIAFKHINKSLERFKNSPDDDKELTLLQTLIMTKGMDASSAMVMVSDMLLAGIDTTSNSVGFFLYHMARNPDKQELLYQDLKKTLPQKEDRITPDIFNKLRYLKSCLKEAQRLNPVAGVNIRVADHDVVFSGYRVPAGTVLGVPSIGIQRDEKYFPNSKKFLPERWLNKDEKCHPYAYMPFGFGVRSCIGRRLAELEMICVAAELIRNFRIEYHFEDIGMYTRMVNVPDKPLRFNFIER